MFHSSDPGARECFASVAPAVPRRGKYPDLRAARGTQIDAFCNIGVGPKPSDRARGPMRWLRAARVQPTAGVLAASEIITTVRLSNRS